MDSATDVQGLYTDPLFCAAAAEMARICRTAWLQHLVSGCNSNASCRLPVPYEGLLCVTSTGSAKGRLRRDDCCLVNAADGHCLAGRRPSTELGLHLALYATLPHCRAVLHSHPRHLLALSLVVSEEAEFLHLPLFEAAAWRSRLAFVPALPPGGQELAQAAARAALSLDNADNCGAVWLTGHGLCCWGRDLGEALTMSEELEHLAAVQLLSLSGTARRA